MKRRISEFRKTLEQNEVLDTFDRYVFESIVEKVIVGGYDEDGNKDPSMLTFIYKTGFKNSVDGSNFKPPRKNSKAAKQRAGLCSHTTDDTKSTCSYHSDDTCGDNSVATKKNPVEILGPGHISRHAEFDTECDKFRIKRIEDNNTVSTVVDMERGNAKH